jgi:hypothetical protein
MLAHTSIQQTQRYSNVTDEELRRGLEVSWNNKGRPLRLASKLIDLLSSPACPRFVPGNIESWLRGGI